MKNQIIKTLVIGALILGLLVPIMIVKSIVNERKQRQSEVYAEMSRGWGSQLILGGIYLESGTDREAPKSQQIECSMKTEIRRKGIFKVPSFTAEFTLSAEFDNSDKISTSMLGMMVSHNGQIELESVQVNGELVDTGKNFIASADPYLYNDLAELSPAAAVKTCTVKFRIRGIEKIAFTNTALSSRIALSADWADPNFFGYLPSERNVTSSGFTAEWNVIADSSYVQNYEYYKYIEDSFGVLLYVPQNVYQQTDRVIKYALLFIFLTFAIFFTFENVFKLRIHPFQYLLVGGALTIFYLLLLSLSEHIAFGISYLAASVCVVVLVGLYCRSILRENKRALIIAAFLAVLYSFLYILIQMQEYSLLLGSAGVFFLLSGTMFLTRKIDWYSWNDK